MAYTYYLLGFSDLDRLSILGGLSGEGARVEVPPRNHRLNRLPGPGEEPDLLLWEELESLRDGPDR